MLSFYVIHFCIFSRILGDYINVYSFTKALAEHVVNDARNIIPTCIIRPSMSEYINVVYKYK